MDALTFRTPKLLRKMTGSQGANKVPILEIDVEMVLLGLKLTYDEFVDLCILCGCDYCNTIVGIGPKTALSLIREHKSIENVLKALEANPTKKGNIPPEWYARKEAVPKEKKEVEKKEGNEEEGEEEKKKEEEEEEMEYVDVPACYVQARVLFLRAEVTPAAEVELNWKPPQEEALKKFLCERMGFAEDRVKSAIQRLMAAQEKKQQMRMDSFFKTTETVESKKRKAEAANLKAKAVAKAAKDAKKKGKAGGMGGRR
jgi:flap endonuclease-1